MVQVKYLATASGEVSTREVDETAFGAKVRRRLLREAVLMYEANRRQGTLSTKSRGEVEGSTRKMWRQKGTGHARPGSRRNPLWRHGGIIFGPKPRSFRYRLPRKALRAALASALLGKLRDGEIAMVDRFSFEEPKAKKAASLLTSLDLGSGRVLVVLEEDDAIVFKSFRNLEDVTVSSQADLNAFDVLRNRFVVLSEGAFDRLKRRVGDGSR